MAKHLDVKVTSLMLDLENPRLPIGARSQSEAIHAMLRAEGPKTLALAKSIAVEGLSPIDRLLAMPVSGENNRFIVLEGNRRLTAITILDEPALADAVLKAGQMKNLKKWSVEYRSRSGVKMVPVAVFDSRKEADIWIERRHRGHQGGVGVVPWGATESARFDARRHGKSSPELQILDFVSEHADMEESIRDKLHNVSITNLKRLISDRDVRKALGIDLSPDGRVSQRFPDKEVLKGLVKIIQDLAHEDIKVADIYTAKDRKKYVEAFAPHELPSATKALPSAVPLIGKAASDTSRPSGVRQVSRIPKKRATLIPSTCNCNVQGSKLQNIYVELRRLKLEDYPNAISVLFRVFLELSVDALIEKHELMTEPQAANSKLRDKLTKVADYLEKANALSEKEAKAAKKVANDHHITGGNVTTLHQYVHNKDLAASPTDLRIAWDNLQRLFESIWPK